ncbi:MAG: hemolysin family protein [Caldisericota bacterium]|nr:hemolysin family protein [Caldisericota bacterium]
MELSSWIYYLLALILLLIFSAFFSGIEAALFSASRIKLESMALRGSAVAKKILELKKKPEKFIGSIVLGNNFVNILASVLAAYLSVSFAAARQLPQSSAIAITTVGMTVIIVLFGEMIPKSISSYHPEKVSITFYSPFLFFWYLFFPFAWFLSVVSKGFLVLFGIKHEKQKVFVDHTEVLDMLHLSKEEGIIKKNEEEMIFSIFEFGDTHVREVMIPRVDVIALPVDANREHILDVVVQSNHSRIPVYAEKMDEIIGVLYVKDLFKLFASGKSEIDLENIAREAYFVPETKCVDELFREMQTKKIQIALVFDEYGGISGIVTMEDLLEEIVGEIQDEHEKGEEIFQKIGENAYLASGTMGIDEFNEFFGKNLPSGEADTIGGIILERLGRLPHPGEEVNFDGFKLIVSKIRGRRILKVKVILKPGG